MRKYLALLCATMMCVCCLGLFACGGGSGSASGSASASSSAVDPAKAIIGDWKLAAMEAQGMTIAGDFSQILGDEGGATLTLKEGGTGSMTMGKSTADLTWKADNGAFTAEVKSTDGTTNSVPFKYEDEAIIFEMPADSGTGNMTFTKDGKYAAAQVISADKATKVTDESKLVGTWKLKGVNMMGMTAYGDPSTLAQLAGSSSDTTATFQGGGKVTIMGSDATCTVTSDGATIDLSGISIPVQMIGDDLYIDMSSALGIEMGMLFAK